MTFLLTFTALVFISTQILVSVQSLVCPIGSVPATNGHNDIPGCGFMGCEWRYTHGQTIEECALECWNHPECNGFSFAPLGGDRNHMDKIVCELNSEVAPTADWTPNQIFCALQKDIMNTFSEFFAIAPDDNQPGYTWQEAEEACQAFGSNLASWSSDEESQIALDARDNVRLASDLSKIPIDVGDHKGTYWMGLNDMGTEGTWHYSDGYDCGGDCASLNMWVPGEPNDAGTGEDCAMMYAGDRPVNSILNDLRCTYQAWGGRRFYAMCNTYGEKPTSSPTPNPTPNPTSPPPAWHDHCQTVLYERANSFTPAQSNKVADVPVVEHFVMEFDFTLFSTPSGWANVMHVGDVNGHRVPAIWVHPNTANTDKSGHYGFHLSMGNAGSWNPWIQVAPEGGMQLNTLYHFRLEVTPTTLTVSFDGHVVTTLTSLPLHVTFGSMPLYLSDPWYTAADIEMSDFILYKVSEDCPHRDYVPIVTGAGMTFDQANDLCASTYGTELATVESLADAKNVMRARRESEEPEGLFWIGLNDRDAEGKWMYVDGSDCGGYCDLLPFWAPGEPNDAGTGEDCAHLWNGARSVSEIVNDIPCSRTEYNSLKFNAMCNAPNHKYIALAPADGSGVDYLGAADLCKRRLGTTLAIIRTEADAYAAMEARALLDSSLPNAWIGLDDLEIEGDWMNADGTNCPNGCENLSFWHPGEPNNSNGEDCAHIWFGTRQPDAMLNDIACELKVYNNIRFIAICESPEDDICLDSNIDMELGMCSKEFGSLEAAVASNTAAIASNSAAISELENDVADNAADILENENAINSIHSDINSLESQIDTLGSDVDSLSSDLSDLENTVNDHDQRLGDVSSKASNNEDDIEDNADRIRSNSGEIDDLRHALDDLEQRIDNLVIRDGDAAPAVPMHIALDTKDKLIGILAAINVSMIAVALCLFCNRPQARKYVSVGYASEDEEAAFKQ